MTLNIKTLTIDFSDFDSGVKDSKLNELASLLQNGSCIISDLTMRHVLECSDASRLLFYSALGKNTSLTSLDIDSNQIGETGAKHISEALKTNSTLTSLNISFNSIGETGAKHISEALKINSSLTSLYIPGNSIGETGAKHISEALKTNSTLTSLVLYNNSIGETGTKHISEALKINSTLTSLYMGSNSIGDSGTKHISEALKTNSSLTKLDIPGNRIGDPGAKFLSEALKTNSTLTSLGVNSNNISRGLRSQINTMLASNREKAKNYTKATEIINSPTPDFPKALKLAQISFTQDKYLPAKNLITKINKLSGISIPPPLHNLTSDIALSSQKTTILRSIQKWSSIASSLLASTNDTQLLSQRQKITEFFAAYGSNLLPNITSLQEMDSTPCIPGISNVWFDILESLKSNFAHLQFKITTATKNLEEQHHTNITAFKSSLSQESSKFEKITCLPFKKRLLQLAQLETSVSQSLTFAYTELQSKTASLQSLGLPTSTTEDTIPPLQEEINSLLSDIRSWKRSEEQFSKSAFIPANLIQKLPNQQGIYGGQATVYEATYLGTPVALKEFFPNVAKDLEILHTPPPKSSSSRSRTTRNRRNNNNSASNSTDSTKSQDPQDPRSKAFWQEAETFARLSHPNIVQHFGSILTPPGILLEWCPKGNLTLLIKDANDLEKDTVSTMNMLHTNSTTMNIDTTSLHPLLSFSRVIQILEQICRGMIYLHSQKIIHFDLKPDNIMFSQNNKAKITDFGIARQLSNTQSKTNSLKGTIPYTAPEVLLQNQQSSSVDVYSFAMLAIELVSGFQPFEELSVVQAANDKKAGKLPPWDEKKSPWLEIRSDTTFRSLVHSWASPNPQERPTFTKILEQLSDTKTRASDIDNLRETAVTDILGKLKNGPSDPESGSTSTTITPDSTPTILDADQLMCRIASLFTNQTSTLKQHVTSTSAASEKNLQTTISSLQKTLLHEYSLQKQDLLSEFQLIKHAQTTLLKQYSQSQLIFGLEIFPDWSGDVPLLQCDLPQLRICLVCLSMVATFLRVI